MSTSLAPIVPRDGVIVDGGRPPFARSVQQFNDWNGAIVASMGWSNTQASGASFALSVLSGVDDGNHPGQLRPTIVATVSAQTRLWRGTAGTGLYPGNGRIYWESQILLSNQIWDAGDPGTSFIGLADGTLLSGTSNALGFYWSNASANWIAHAEVATVVTTADTGIALALGAWVRLGIEVAADGSSATWFINRAPVATLTAVPTLPLIQMFEMLRDGVTAGTATVQAFLDYCALAYEVDR